MKAMSFKKFLRLYGTITTISVLAAVVITIYGRDWLTVKTNGQIGIIIAGIVSIILSITTVHVTNNLLYEKYRKKLYEDALLMVEELNRNHLCDPTKLNELIMELKAADIIKKK